ncbi:MAG: phosphoribosylformimino-5-aminoimidazole carboxamide ribotide isomerase [Chloroflexota bacterium]|nr:phosphoribosylformimino-5-aminoimidazole carboxamide ribotide isomerase [Chloroflexota bacterium]
MRFRPCIDLRNGKVVQIVGGTLSDAPEALVTNFETERAPADYARMYQADSLAGGHVIALGPGNHEAALAALRAFPGGMQVGGGITPDNARIYLDAGASHVIVTSYVFRDGRLDAERLKWLIDAVGRERLVLDLSCRLRNPDEKKGDDTYWVVTDRWQRFSETPITRATLAQLAASCDEFLVHGVDVEGLRLGIDTTLVELLGEWSPIPVTYAGGARTLADLDLVKARGRGRVDLSIGSALDIFGGDLPYQAVVAWQRRQEME